MNLGIAATDDWNGLTAEELIHEADVGQKKLDARSVLALPFRAAGFRFVQPKTDSHPGGLNLAKYL
jgi:hypothetical protein